MAVEASLAFVLFIGCTTAMGISLPDSEAELNSISRTNSMWTDCCKSTDALTLISVSVSPNPPERGTTCHVSLIGELAEEVTGGSIYVYLKYANVMTVLKKKYDFCDFLKKTGSECPLEPDMISLAIETYVPSSFPPGKYIGRIVATNQDDQELVCVGLDLNIGM